MRYMEKYCGSGVYLVDLVEYLNAKIGSDTAENELRSGLNK